MDTFYRNEVWGLEIFHASIHPAGAGTYTAEVQYKYWNDKKYFKTTTNDMTLIDRIKETDVLELKYEYINWLIETKLRNEIEEWLLSCDFRDDD